MVSLYTDKAREERYFRLRRRRKRCEKISGIAFAVTVVVGLTELAADLFSGLILAGLTGQESKEVPLPGILTLLPAAAMILAVVAVIRKNWLIAAADILFIIFLAMFGFLCKFYIGVLDIPPLGAMVYVGRVWERLKEQEGFPRFRIDYEETQNRERLQAGFIEHRAVEEGVREEQEELDPGAAMEDLMDAGKSKQQLGAKLQNYHNRYEGADAVIHAADKTTGVMNELETGNTMNLREL